MEYFLKPHKQLRLRAISAGLMLCLSFGLVSCSALKEKGSAASTTAYTSALKAGAGNGDIVFPASMFPVEGFGGVIHDNPRARVLVMESGIKVAIVALELVNTPEQGIELTKTIVHEKTGTPLENIWVHSTHAITTPHAPRDPAQNKMFISALTTAVTQAADEAAASFQDAVVGVGTGKLDINVNRDIQMPDGSWNYGLGGTLFSNKTMTILRFNSASTGKPIGFFISYGIKPTAVDNVGMSENIRQISSDVPGLATTIMEARFGVPALFAMPASGDQVPKQTTTYNVWSPDKKTAKLVETSVKDGLDIVNQLGTDMGNAAIAIANSITPTRTSQNIKQSSTTLTVPARNREGATEGTADIAISTIRLGDIAFVGFRPEVNAVTEQQLQRASPYAHTLLLSFVDGDQKYMPDADAYNKNTVEAQKAGFAPGAAEKFVDASLKLLNGLK